jgi:hypothetical protein
MYGMVIPGYNAQSVALEREGYFGKQVSERRAAWVSLSTKSEKLKPQVNEVLD